MPLAVVSSKCRRYNNERYVFARLLMHIFGEELILFFICADIFSV